MVEVTTGHTSNDAVNHPVHYNAHPSGLEAIEVCRLMPFTTGNAVKYIWRADLKNGGEDLKKARWYLRDHLRDHLGKGLAPRPSKEAQRMLNLAMSQDPDFNRRALLQFIANGYLAAAIDLINVLLGEQK